MPFSPEISPESEEITLEQVQRLLEEFNRRAERLASAQKDNENRASLLESLYGRPVEQGVMGDSSTS